MNISELSTCKYCGTKDGEIKYNWVIGGICRNCNKKKEDEADFKNAQENGSITRNDSIMCPYCGYVETDTFEQHKRNNWDCPECQKKSKLEVEYTAHFTTTKKEEQK